MLVGCTVLKVLISVKKMTQKHENRYKCLRAKCDLVSCVFTAVQMEH